MENDNHPSHIVLFCVDTLVSNSFSNSSNTANQLEGRQIANKNLRPSAIVFCYSPLGHLDK